jgi:hypothetical protein
VHDVSELFRRLYPGFVVFATQKGLGGVAVEALSLFRDVVELLSRYSVQAFLGLVSRVALSLFPPRL